MKTFKEKPLLLIIPVFCIWVAALIYSYLQFADGYKYGIAYGQMLTPTITDEAGTIFEIYYSQDSIKILETGVGSEISFCKYHDGMINTGHDSPKVDIPNTHIYHEEDGIRSEVTRAELFSIIRNLPNGTPENTKAEFEMDDKTYLRPELTSIHFTGEYSGDIVLKQNLSIPAVYTNYSEFVSRVEKNYQTRLIKASVFVIAGLVLLTVPLILMAVKEKHLALIIYCIIGVILIVFIARTYRYFERSAIGINWYSYVGK